MSLFWLDDKKTKVMLSFDVVSGEKDKENLVLKINDCISFIDGGKYIIAKILGFRMSGQDNPPTGIFYKPYREGKDGQEGRWSTPQMRNAEIVSSQYNSIEKIVCPPGKTGYELTGGKRFLHKSKKYKKKNIKKIKTKNIKTLKKK